MSLSRRSFLRGLVAAPAVIAIDRLMPVRTIRWGEKTLTYIPFEIEKHAVNAPSRRLSAEWTIEIVEDMEAYHGLDAEDEIARHLADEMTREAEKWAMDDLMRRLDTSSPPRTRWSRRPSGLIMLTG